MKRVFSENPPAPHEESSGFTSAIGSFIFVLAIVYFALVGCMVVIRWVFNLTITKGWLWGMPAIFLVMFAALFAIYSVIAHPKRTRS